MKKGKESRFGEPPMVKGMKGGCVDVLLIRHKSGSVIQV